MNGVEMFGHAGVPMGSTSTMFPYDVPVPQPYPYPFPVTQPYLQNTTQFVDVPVLHTIQPVMVPTPFGVPVPQPVPVPIDRPCAVPYPVGVPIPQPYAVPQPVFFREQVGVPVPFPVPVPVLQQPQYHMQNYQVERFTEEPVYIKRYRRRRYRRRCRSLTPPPAPLAPIIIPIAIQAPAAAQPAYQITEYVQDIYPPAQIFTEQVPVGYVVKTISREEAARFQMQQPMIPQSGLIQSSPQGRPFLS